MMKKLILILTVMSSAISVLTQDRLYICKNDGTVTPYAISMIDSISFTRRSDVTDYVLINGVKWATRNLDAGGGFVANPEDYGALYQWGRTADGHESRTSTISFITSNRYPYDWRTPQNDALWNAGTETTPVKTLNDPCPVGWRVPTISEVAALLATEVAKEWTTVNGVNGYKFTDRATGKSIFLPAGGYRDLDDGVFEEVGSQGLYYTGSTNSYSVRSLVFTIEFAGVSNFINRAQGLSLRPVVE